LEKRPGAIPSGLLIFFKEPSASASLRTEIISQNYQFSVLRVRFLPIPGLIEVKNIIAAIQVASDAVLLL
jgi:hypothetical protein